MTEKRKTYRHRNTKNHWASKELIHTFWVGQRVARTWERKNYMDRIGELGIVQALPEKRGGNLIVLTDDGQTTPWGPTEAVPLRVLLARNRQRFLDVAADIAAGLKQLDENGVEIG